MNEKDYQDYIEKEYGATSKLSDLFDPPRRMFIVNDQPFVILSVGKSPIRVHVRCDELQGKKLIAEYESIMAGHDLDPKHWITVVGTQQLTDEQIKDLIRAAYHIVAS